MRGVRALAGWSQVSRSQPWLPGLPHIALALLAGVVFGATACITGLLFASLLSFVVFLPLAALAANGWRPITAEAPAPALSARTRWLLLALWTATAWGGAVLATL